MKRLREITDEEIFEHICKQRLKSHIAHLDIIEDVWFVILTHAIDAPWPLERGEATDKPLVCSLGLVCKQWQRLLTRAITTAFMELKRHSIEVDTECRMRSPIMLWMLKRDMYAFCCKLKMKPADILMTVAPEWGNVPLTDKELQEYRLYSLPMICAWGNNRLHRHQLGRNLIEYHPDVHHLVMGPWSFGGTWDAYLLALFLLCRPDRYRAAQLEKLALIRFNSIWGNPFGKFDVFHTPGILNLLHLYYQLSSFPMAANWVFGFPGENLVCVHRDIGIEMLYALFPSILDWVSYNEELHNLPRGMARALAEQVPPVASVWQMDLNTNWKYLFRDPMTFSNPMELHKAYMQLKGVPLFLSIWRASKDLRDAYREALYRDRVAHATLGGGEILHPV